MATIEPPTETVPFRCTVDTRLGSLWPGLYDTIKLIQK